MRTCVRACVRACDCVRMIQKIQTETVIQVSDYSVCLRDKWRIVLLCTL